MKPQTPDVETEPAGEIDIREMPDRKLLADFLRGLHGAVTVIFNRERGRFERVGADRANGDDSP